MYTLVKSGKKLEHLKINHKDKEILLMDDDNKEVSWNTEKVHDWLNGNLALNVIVEESDDQHKPIE